MQFIGRRFLDMGYPWHPTNAPLDAGIDGFVEVRDVQTGEATNAWIAVQSKGRTTLEKETDISFEFTCTPRDLDYWRRGNMPVLLVVSRPARDEAWWVSVKDHIISGSDLRDITDADPVKFQATSTERFRQGAADLIEKANAHVVVCLLPEGFVRRIDVPATPETGPRSRRGRKKGDEDIWHDMFKANAIQLARPVQVLRPATYGGKVHHFTRDGTAVREMQDEATRAWNFFCALYYKGGGIPWRLARESTDLMTCYMGISFYHDPASASLRTSVAQVFNERGEGMVVRGGPAVLDEQPTKGTSDGDNWRQGTTLQDVPQPGSTHVWELRPSAPRGA